MRSRDWGRAILGRIYDLARYDCTGKDATQAINNQIMLRYSRKGPNRDKILVNGVIVGDITEAMKRAAGEKRAREERMLKQDATND